MKGGGVMHLAIAHECGCAPPGNAPARYRWLRIGYMPEPKPFDIETRWPDLFEPLTRAQRRNVVQTLASQWYEGWEPAREDVADLAAYVSGGMSDAEYEERAAARARRRAAERG